MTKMSIFDIQGDFRSLRDSIMEAGGECDDHKYEVLKAIKLTAEEKLTQCYFVIQQWAAEAKVAKEAEEVAKSHKKRRESSIENMEKRMIALALELGLEKLDTPHLRFNIQEGKYSLEVQDVGLLPVDFVTAEMKEVVTVDNAALKAHLESLRKSTETLFRKLNPEFNEAEIQEMVTEEMNKFPGAVINKGLPFIKFLKPKGE